MYHGKEIQTYEDARTFLAGGRDKTSRPIACNTRIETRDGDAIAVRYHATDVVTYYPDGEVVLNSGGWQTYTTKDRFNRFSPMQVWSEGNGIWAAETGPDSARYEDGLTMSPDGTFQDWKADRYAGRKAEQALSNGPAPETTEHLRKRVQEYAAGYEAAFKSGDVGEPGLGDCFFCAMLDVKTGLPVPHADHIYSHLDEAYYVPSLLFNAIKSAGYQDPVFTWQWWQRSPGNGDVARTVRRYVYAQLGLVV